MLLSNPELVVNNMGQVDVMTKNATKDEGQLSSEGGLLAQNAKKRSKTEIALTAVVLGGPFVYLGLILVVLYNPNVMTWLGLEPLVQYLMHLQPAGYENLVQLNSPEFADYFFHLHAASILIYVFFLVTIVITTVFACESGYIKPMDFNKIKNDLQDFNRGMLIAVKPTIGLWLGFLFVPILGWLLFSSPEQMEIKSKLPPDNRGVGFYIFLSFLYSFLFIGCIAASIIFLRLNCWPNLKSRLVVKQKPDHQITNSTKQQHRED